MTWLLLIFRLSIVGSGGYMSSQSSTSATTNGQNGDCVTKHGVTHCWERLGYVDPPAPPKTFSLPYGHTQPTMPEKYGAYPLEKRE